MSRYPNPLLPGFNPDPSVVLADGVYYLVTSTFEYLPGIPIYRSADLVEWEQLGNVITREAQADLSAVPTGGGVWAPTIRFRDGVFYVIVSVAMGEGCVVYTAENPAGPWSDGLRLPGVYGIDPDLAWGPDGTAYVTFSGLVTTGEELGRHDGVVQVAVDLVTGETLGEPVRLWSGSGFKFPEAPHLYERDGQWYLMIAEGGTERGHGVSIARGPSPSGPFVPGPANPFLSARSTGRPIQNTGHGDLVATPDGGTAIVLLGVRPRGATQAFSALGRETFLTTVDWVDGWPMAEPVQLDPRTDEIAYRVDFTANLDEAWITPRRMPAEVADTSARPGRLTLRATEDDLEGPRPAFIGRRQQNQTMTASTVVEVSAGIGGIAMRYDEQNFVEIIARAVPGGTEVNARAVIPSFVKEAVALLPAGRVELRIESRPAPMSFALEAMTSDFLVLSASAGELTVDLGEVDGRSYSAETAASFTGRVIGLVAIEGEVVFDGFHYRGSED